MASAQKIVVVPTLADLLNDLDRISALPKDVIAELRGQIAKLDTLLLGRLLAGGDAQPSADGDRLLDVTEAAAKLGLSRDALYRNEYPFMVKIGNRRRFSERGIEKFIRNRTGF
jgi:predicted DNA-binding transcriptional regulator AlpA